MAEKQRKKKMKERERELTYVYRVTNYELSDERNIRNKNKIKRYYSVFSDKSLRRKIKRFFFIVNRSR